MKAVAPIHAGALTPGEDDSAVFRVLLVEADDGLRRSFSHALQRAGFTVTEAQDALQARALLEERPDSYFHLVIKDVQMPLVDDAGSSGGCTTSPPTAS